MPRGDRTGPAGFGSMTGRGLGYCAGYDTPGYTKGPSIFKILNLIQDDNMGNYIDKTVALYIIYIASLVCDGFELPLEY